MDIYDYIDEICDFLDIDCPEIEFTNKYRSPTMLAELVIRQEDEPILRLRFDYENQADFYTAIAHELRHVWQIENGFFDFSNYKTVDIIGIEMYNLQAEEIDANAFSRFWMIPHFKLDPLFDGLPEVCRNAINKRFKELLVMYSDYREE